MLIEDYFSFMLNLLQVEVNDWKQMQGQRMNHEGAREKREMVCPSSGMELKKVCVKLQHEGEETGYSNVTAYHC